MGWWKICAIAGLVLAVASYLAAAVIRVLGGTAEDASFVAPGLWAGLALVVVGLIFRAFFGGSTRGGSASEPEVGSDWSPKPRSITRTYRGTPSQAASRMTNDASGLEQRGYVPISQFYAPGQYRGIDFLAALLLCLILVGILIFIFMLVVKPAGTLTVIYELREVPVAVAPAPATPVAPADSPPSAETRLADLVQLRDAGLITREEYDAKRDGIIANL